MFKKYFSFLFVAGLLIPATAALAKGNFDYVTVKGPGITGEINITNPALTEDFFAFADFSQGEAPAPADPGEGYQVIRVYVETVDNKPTDQVFDQLHYYPYTGYVFYDGIVNGESEYDGKWYAANPAADAPFRAVLAERARLNWIPMAVVVLLMTGFFIAYLKK
ncbi:MAG: hypothetical protein Q8L87_07380 [Anaerolineales bacterium]|jgi:hypothetical protein|nr:hypothetical protein [Anaerolineales bacterium]